MIHVRFEGRSLEIGEKELHMPKGWSDEQVKERLAHYLDVSVARLRDYVVDRRPNGTLVLRPEAVYG